MILTFICICDAFIVCARIQPHARAHLFRQNVMLNVLRSTHKKGKKALGKGLISDCLVKERKEEVERAGGMGQRSRTGYRRHFLAFLGGVTGRPEPKPPPLP